MIQLNSIIISNHQCCFKYFLLIFAKNFAFLHVIWQKHQFCSFHFVFMINFINNDSTIYEEKIFCYSKITFCFGLYCFIFKIRYKMKIIKIFKKFKFSKFVCIIRSKKLSYYKFQFLLLPIPHIIIISSFCKNKKLCSIPGQIFYIITDWVQ